MTAKGTSFTKPGTRHLTLVAALLSMLGPFSIDTYLPSFPEIELEFGVSRAVLSQSISVYLLAFAVSTLFWGPLADRFGRRLVIVISMLFYTLGSIGCALADDMGALLLMRTLQGLAASGGFIASRAMIRDAHDAESAHRAMAQVTLLFALSPAIAPVLGGWLHDVFGWRSVFWFLTIFGAVLALTGLLVRETLADEHRQTIRPGAVAAVYLRALLHKQFPALVLSLGFTFAGVFLYIAGAPTVIYDFIGLGSNEFGWLFVPLVSGLMLGSAISSWLAHRWPVRRTISTGFGVMVVAAMLNLFATAYMDAGILTVIAPLVLYVIGVAILMPAITVLALDCLPLNRGSAASMQGFLQSVINAAVASLAVPLLQASWQGFVAGQVFFLLLAVVLWLWLRHGDT